MERVINYTGTLTGLRGLLIAHDQNAIQTFERFDNYIFYMKRTLWNTFERQELCNPQILAAYTSEDAEFSAINKILLEAGL
ncbi:MAG: hypothetical protein AABX16_00120 [Nanoarchaeota archaeon]